MKHDLCAERKGEVADRVKCAAETREEIETVKDDERTNYHYIPKGVYPHGE